MKSTFDSTYESSWEHVTLQLVTMTLRNQRITYNGRCSTWLIFTPPFKWAKKLKLIPVRNSRSGRCEEQPVSRTELLRFFLFLNKFWWANRNRVKVVSFLFGFISKQTWIRFHLIKKRCTWKEFSFIASHKFLGRKSWNSNWAIKCEASKTALNHLTTDQRSKEVLSKNNSVHRRILVTSDAMNWS